MHLNEKEYQNQFLGKKREKALERAWKNRDFEIELYWKRATYFWTFLVATFAGYFVVISHSEISDSFPQAEYIVICLGFVFSLSWYLANRGSKKWQENWEQHIDMLEEEVTGNIYKTVLDKTGFSVSGINLNVSLFVVSVWILLASNYFYKSYKWGGSWSTFDIKTFLISIVTIGFVISLWGQRNKSERNPTKDNEGRPEISFSLRHFKYVNRDIRKINKNKQE